MFDQTREYILDEFGNKIIVYDNTPIRYLNDGTALDYCMNNQEYTTGQSLYSGSTMVYQRSCRPNTGNAGNYYSWPAATAGGNKSSGDEFNSVCPKGWQLTANNGKKSFNDAFTITYIANLKKDDDARLLPISLVRSGSYGNTFSGRSLRGTYWSSFAAHATWARSLIFSDREIAPQSSSGSKYDGRSVRCVSR